MTEETNNSNSITNNNNTTTTNESNETNESTNEEERELNCIEQREAYKKLGYKTQQVGDTWYCIDKKWMDSWILYTAYDKPDEDLENGVEGLLTREDINKPAPIDNSSLQSKENENALSKELQENLTHKWIHEDQWNLLHKWYAGGPAFPRKVYERGTNYAKEKYINMYPTFVNFVFCNDEGEVNETKVETKSYPPDYNLKEIVEELEEELSTEEDFQSPIIHLWAKFKLVRSVYPITNKKGVNLTKEDYDEEDQERWVEIPDDYLKTSLDQIGITAESLILVEKKIGSGTEATWQKAKKGDTWKEIQSGDILDIKDMQNKFYESLVRAVGKEGTDNFGKICVHYIGWQNKWDEWISSDIEAERIKPRGSETTGPHRAKKRSAYTSNYYSSSSWSYYSHDKGQPDVRGVIGLRNLGNTCFMNSTIQCLAQSPWLTEYFLSGDFAHHVNRENPLGWKGKVADAWSELLKDMFSDQYRTVAPRNFKSQIGEVAPRFMGYAQQDSQELLSFLLDGLHEDLNQIKKKPPTEPIESDGKADKTVAQLSWRTYLKRNQSKIVDLLQGQYKSRVECPDCPRVSITFDPYMFLSVPLPTERYKVLQFTWIPSNSNAKPTIYGIKMLKMADIKMFKKQIGKKFEVNPDELFVCDVWKSKIHRELRNREYVNDINPRNDDIFIYHSPKPVGSTEESEDSKENETTTTTTTTDSSTTNNNNSKNESTTENNEETSNNENSSKTKTENETEELEDSETTTQSGTGSGNNKSNGASGSNSNNNRRSNKPQNTGNDFHTFVIRCQTKVKVTNYLYNSREEDEPIGVPLLITFSRKVDVTYKEARQRIFNLVKPYLTDESLTLESEEFPFAFYATYGFNGIIQIKDSEELLPLDERNFKFILHFGNREAYNEDLYPRENRPRDESAPAPSSNSGRSGRNSKPVELEACIAAFTEEEILDENDQWYCNKCKDFKCARKKLDLWRIPDLLIIHLKRFSYTQQWRDRINTLVKFPIEGLSLKQFIVNEEEKPEDCIYDLYAISNHMGGLGGGHYTAYAKNLENGKWYELDDSRTSEVRDVNSMVSPAAYVLYYKRREHRNFKHRASRVDLGLPNTEESNNPTTSTTINENEEDNTQS